MMFYIGIALFGSLSACNRDSVAQKLAEQYDVKTGQKPVYSHKKLDSILDFFHTIHASELPADYIQNTGTDKHTELKYNQYYVVNGDDIFKYVAGHFRVKDFISKDTFYYQNIDSMPAGIAQYWLMERKELHKFLDLLLWMRQNGLNDSAITVKNGHRNPAYNQKVGGVSGSYHMRGMAIDIKVGDVNRDGEANAADKKLLLDVLEKDIIANEGGLGLYPNSDVIHFDVRGRRARWNSH